jgi:hypothetical protein
MENTTKVKRTRYVRPVYTSSARRSSKNEAQTDKNVNSSAYADLMAVFEEDTAGNGFNDYSIQKLSFSSYTEAKHGSNFKE